MKKPAAAKSSAAGKAAKAATAAKPAAAGHKPVRGGGTSKGSAHHKHHVAGTKKHKTAGTKKHVHRGLALGDVSCCAADALAWSLRLAGWPVDSDDVLALYKLTADSPDAGATILATLDAAHVFGLAGVQPVSFEAVTDLDDPRSLLLGVDLPGRHTVFSNGGWISWGRWFPPGAFPDAVIEEAWVVTWP